MKQSTVAIIGAGTVGASIAYTLITHNFVSTIIMVDCDSKRCQGEIEDLSNALPFVGNATIINGTLAQAALADIIIIAAGVPQKSGQTRLELLTTNTQVVSSIIKGLQPLNKQSIIIVVTNPVDILTRLVQELSGLPHNQIFGSGTLLDTQRLRGIIGKKVDIDPRSIHVFIIGEHGDSQCVAWSSGQIAGVPLAQFPGLTQESLEAMAQQARQKAYDIIACKGSTSFGIAACVSAYCQNILFDQKRIVPVSCFVKSFGVCFSMPAVLGKNGIERIIDLSLQEDELLKLTQSAEILQKTYEQMGK